jgi:hypothetical protein
MKEIGGREKEKGGRGGGGGGADLYPPRLRKQSTSRAGIFEQSMGTRNQVGIGFFVPARQAT